MIRPLHDLVLLEVLDSEVIFAPVDPRAPRGGQPVTVRISDIVASTGDRLYKRGRIVATGPGRRHRRTGARLPLFVAPGDLVVYQDWQIDWHDGGAMWPGPGDLALVRARHVVLVLLDEDVWLDFPRHYGAAPPIPDSAFRPETTNVRVEPGRADMALERWGLK